MMKRRRREKKKSTGRKRGGGEGAGRKVEELKEAKTEEIETKRK